MKIIIDVPITKELTDELSISIWSTIYEDLAKRPELHGKESELDGILNKVIERRIGLLKRKIELSKRELVKDTSHLKVLESILAKMNASK